LSLESGLTSAVPNSDHLKPRPATSDPHRSNHPMAMPCSALPQYWYDVIVHRFLGVLDFPRGTNSGVSRHHRWGLWRGSSETSPSDVSLSHARQSATGEALAKKCTSIYNIWFFLFCDLYESSQ
jgi:hypothetical protein